MKTPNAAPLKPEKVLVNPKLAGFTSSFFPPQVLDVTDGVYVARGYNRDNPVLIDGPDGLVVIDPGESVQAAQKVKGAFIERLGNIFDKKLVKTIIYTHHHDCHIHGSSVFANPGTEVIGHENLMTTLYTDWYCQLYPSRAEGGAKMAGSLFANDPDWFAGGGLFAVQIPGDSGFIPPTQLVHDQMKTSSAGVKITTYSVPGETRDVLVVWLEDKRVLVQIANLYQAMPAITTLRGAYPRNPLDYIASIDFYRSLNPEYLVLTHGPNPVEAGQANVSKALTSYRDAIQFTHDQTVQGMNKGLTPEEIMETLKLPPHLASDPYLQEYYGQVYRNIYEIFWWYRGYFTGKCRDLFAHSPDERAQMAAELAGGIPKLASQAEKALASGKLEWAMELADDVLLLDPANAGARTTKSKAVIALAEGTMNAQVRNYLLSEYLLETKQRQVEAFGNPKLAFASIERNAVSLMPMDALMRILAVNLNASRSVDKDVVVGLVLTDTQAAGQTPRYGLHVRRGVLEVSPDTPKNAQFKIITASAVWKDLALAKVTPQDAIAKKMITLSEGSPQAFYDFMSLFY